MVNARETSKIARENGASLAEQREFMDNLNNALPNEQERMMDAFRVDKNARVPVRNEQVAEQRVAVQIGLEELGERHGIEQPQQREVRQEQIEKPRKVAEQDGPRM